MTTTTQAHYFDQATTRARAAGRDVAAAGRQLWLAGLGTAGALGERGREVFADLVARGERQQQKRQARRTAAESKAKTLGRDLEHQVEERVGAALHRFGVPSRDDVQALIARIEKLTRKVEGLSAHS